MQIILCQSVFCHLALRFDDHLKFFEHGISKGGKVGEVECYPEFFQLQLQFIDVACLFVVTPPLPRGGGTAQTAIQVYAVNLCKIRLGERWQPISN